VRAGARLLPGLVRAGGRPFFPLESPGTLRPARVRSQAVSAVDVLDSYLAGLPGGVRRLAHAEWGITVTVDALGERPLDVGVRVADGLVRAQAWALPAGAAVDPWLLLHWNRQTRLVRFASARSGDVWVHADVPAAGLDERAVDRLLGLVVQAAVRAREYAAAAETTAGGTGERTWLSGAARRRAAD
jgi:hypothetical protein